jgi:hypothetical protein
MGTVGSTGVGVASMVPLSPPHLGPPTPVIELIMLRLLSKEHT